MTSAVDDMRTATTLSAPVYLRLQSEPLAGTMLSVREHQPSKSSDRQAGPLFVATLHPGFLTGSYADRDYFELLAPLFFDQAAAGCRLRLFTVNHPGYDLPAGQRVDPHALQPYSIHQQPAAMHAAYSWIFDHLLAEEREIHWLAYGHSMGGLALSRYQPDTLIDHLARQRRRLSFTRVLSAPSFCLYPHALAILDQLETLQAIKRRFGRWPIYAPLANSLYRAFAPFFYEREAERFSIGALADYGDFSTLNPFVLLAQARELLRLSPRAVGGPRLLANAHVILARQDGMVDFEATSTLVSEARRAGHPVEEYIVDSTHLLERDAPGEVVRILSAVLADAVAACQAA